MKVILGNEKQKLGSYFGDDGDDWCVCVFVRVCTCVRTRVCVYTGQGHPVLGSRGDHDGLVLRLTITLCILFRFYTFHLFLTI